MLIRIGRLVRTECMKLTSHPFLFIALGIIVLSVPAAAWLKPLFTGQKETVWRSFNAIQLFSYGADFGISVAAYILVIFSSMLFAGEFDRGTIKVLLTRPITRTDLFLAKTATAILLALFFYVVVLYVSLLNGTLRGDLGPVWDDQFLIQQTSYDHLVAHMKKAVLMGFLPLVTACFLGMLVSNLTETSGYAVAIALIAYVLISFVTWRYIFNFYPSYAFEILRRYSEGSSARWNPDIDDRLLYLKVPLAYAAAFLAAAYGLFRFKNVSV